MNEELNNKLIEALTASMETIGDIKDFTIEQAPEVLQQALVWYGVYYFILFIVALVLLGLSIKFGIQWGSYIKNYKATSYSDDTQLWNSLGLLGTSIFMLTGILLMINLQWLQIWIAPKLWLLEWLKGLT